MRFFWHRDRKQQELQQELQSHLELAAGDKRSRGESATDAKRSAHREFGNIALIEQVTRDQWGTRWLEEFLQDLRYGARMLRKSPGFAIIAILTLALGIGANTTIFSWIRAVLLNPLPGAGDSSRVVALEELAPSGDWLPISYPDFRDLRDNSKLLDSMTVSYPMALAVGEDRLAERISGELVSGNYFNVLKIDPEIGRFFSAGESDDAQNAHPVAVLSYSFWRTRYHAEPSVIGTTIRINRHPYTVIGITPKGFHGSLPGLDFQIFVPATMFAQLNATGDWMLQDRKTRTFRVLARLAPQVEIAQARAEIASIAAHVAEVNRTTNDGVSATVLPIWKSHWGIQDSMRAPLGILMGAAGVVLLIVCANIANLLLTHATSRQKELSVRVALGAPRSRLVRQLLTETALLSVAGSVLGLLSAFWLVGSLRYLIPTAAARNLLRPPIDSGVLWFTAALAIGVVMLAGIAPAIYGARGNVHDVLKAFGRDSTGGRHSQRLRTLLVVAEMALAVIAIVGAGLFLKSFRLARMVQPGFDPQHVALARFSMSTAGYDAAQADAFCRRLRERLESQPGVVSVSYADYVPLSVAAGSWEDLQIEGHVPGVSENMKIYRSVVAPGYFDTMKIPLLAGRDFTLNDDISHAPAMIVNQTFVNRFLHGEYAIGRKVNGWGHWFTIIGVAQDAKYYRLTEAATPYFYVPMRQIYRPEFAFNFFVRTTGSPDQAIAALPREAQAIDPALPAFGAMPLAEFISASLFQEQIAANLMSLLAGIAFVLAAMGLYGVMAFAVAQRTREIGIRLAMGAQRSSVLRLVARQSVVLLLAGLTAGLLTAAALGRFIAWMLFSVSPSDASVYAFAAAATILIAVAATLMPAVRAMQVDPLVALRYE